MKRLTLTLALIIIQLTVFGQSKEFPFHELDLTFKTITQEKVIGNDTTQNELLIKGNWHVKERSILYTDEEDTWLFNIIQWNEPILSKNGTIYSAIGLTYSEEFLDGRSSGILIIPIPESNTIRIRFFFLPEDDYKKTISWIYSCKLNNH